MDFSPSPCPPRTPTEPCLVPQRHQSPSPSRPWSAADPALAVQSLPLQCLAPAARQRPEAFRRLAARLYVWCVNYRGWSVVLATLGCGVGAATLWRDVQAVVPDP